MVKTYKKFSGLKSRFTFAILIWTFILSSCTTNYYLVSSSEETPVYSQDNVNTDTAIIPANKRFIYWGNGKRPKTKYGQVHGHSSYLTSWSKLAKLNKKQVMELTFKEDTGYYYNQVSNSIYGSGTSGKNSSTSTSSGGTVHVKGYTRKDGTYVRPHTRSAPRRH